LNFLLETHFRAEISTFGTSNIVEISADTLISDRKAPLHTEI